MANMKLAKGRVSDYQKPHVYILSFAFNNFFIYFIINNIIVMFPFFVEECRFAWANGTVLEARYILAGNATTFFHTQSINKHGRGHLGVVIQVHVHF